MIPSWLDATLIDLPIEEPLATETERLEKLLSNRVNYQKRIKALVNDARHVVFYGCGRILASIIETWMAYVDRPIDFVCDSNPEKWGHLIHGVLCLSPEELEGIKEQCVIFVTIGQFREVFNSLSLKGFQTVNVIYKYDLKASTYLKECNINLEAKGLAIARSMLSDSRSKQVFDAVVNRVMGGGVNPEKMESVYDEDQYFPSDIIKLSGEESFVDVGAFDGDTVKEFIKRSQARFTSIDALELDSSNFSILKAAMQLLPYGDRIKAHPFGAWDTETIVSYNSAEDDSTIGEGVQIGKVIPLDKLLINERCTFLKLDVEGAELHALKGAENLIKSQQPKLAVCLYHHFCHLWAIPLYIKQLNPGYTIYLRHHSRLEYETVCYALP